MLGWLCAAVAAPVLLAGAAALAILRHWDRDASSRTERVRQRRYDFL